VYWTPLLVEEPSCPTIDRRAQPVALVGDRFETRAGLFATEHAAFDEPLCIASVVKIRVYLTTISLTNLLCH